MSHYNDTNIEAIINKQIINKEMNYRVKWVKGKNRYRFSWEPQHLLHKVQPLIDSFNEMLELKCKAKGNKKRRRRKIKHNYEDSNELAFSAEDTFNINKESQDKPLRNVSDFKQLKKKRKRRLNSTSVITYTYNQPNKNFQSSVASVDNQLDTADSTSFADSSFIYLIEDTNYGSMEMNKPDKIISCHKKPNSSIALFVDWMPDPAGMTPKSSFVSFTQMELKFPEKLIDYLVSQAYVENK